MRHIGIGVGLAVAIDRHPAIAAVDHGHVNQLARLSDFFRSVQIARALEAVAAGDPATLLPFAEDDGIEHLAMCSISRVMTPPPPWSSVSATQASSVRS